MVALGRGYSKRDACVLVVFFGAPDVYCRARLSVLDRCACFDLLRVPHR